MAVGQKHVQEFVNEMGMSFNIRSYSGRGMYGDSCVAITVDRDQSMGDALAMIFNYGVDLGGVDGGGEDEKLIRAIIMILQSACTDSMGTGSVIYFPAASSEGVCMPDEGDDEDEDDGTDWTED